MSDKTLEAALLELATKWYTNSRVLYEKGDQIQRESSVVGQMAEELNKLIKANADRTPRHFTVGDDTADVVPKEGDTCQQGDTWFVYRDGGWLPEDDGAAESMKRTKAIRDTLLANLRPQDANAEAREAKVRRFVDEAKELSLEMPPLDPEAQAEADAIRKSIMARRNWPREPPTVDPAIAKRARDAVNNAEGNKLKKDLESVYDYLKWMVEAGDENGIVDGVGKGAHWYRSRLEELCERTEANNG